MRTRSCKVNMAGLMKQWLEAREYAPAPNLDRIYHEDSMITIHNPNTKSEKAVDAVERTGLL